MIVTFNLVTLILCVALCQIIYRNFIAIPTNEKKRFELFEIRDRLSLKAMQGVVNEDSEEYKFLMKNINRAIWLYDTDFRIVDFFRVLINPQLKQTEKIKSMLKKIDGDEHLRSVFLNYFDYVHDLIHRETKVLLFTAKCVAFCVKLTQKKKLSFVNKTVTTSTSQLHRYENNILRPALNELRAAA